MVIRIGLIIELLLSLATLCVAQDGVEIITRILSNSNSSGSISYWSPQQCGSDNDRYPPFPKVTRVGYERVSAGDLLRLSFAESSTMRVSEESGGLIRMYESDVPLDVLNIKIHHLSFNDTVAGDDLFRGPNMAMRAIFSTPEVQVFGKLHNVGPFFSARIPGNASSGKRAHGDLDNVSVSQALDYLLQEFPGFWIYGNCTSANGARKVFFWFVEVPGQTPQ